MLLDEAKKTYPTAFAEIEARIEQWKGEITDSPEVTLIGATIVEVAGNKVLEITTLTDLVVDDTDEPVHVRFRATLEAKVLH